VRGELNRHLVDQSLSIMDLKRFVVDYVYAHGLPRPIEPVPQTRPDGWQWLVLGRLDCRQPRIWSRWATA